jgi:hypothetical protein
VAVTFPYPPDVELAMQILYRSLREHDRRRYAAVEAAKLGHGGLDYLATLLGCDPKTIRRGQQDLQQLADGDLEDITPDERTRRPGGGRKPATESRPDLLSSFHAVLEDHTGGDPMRAQVIGTDLTPREIGEALMEKDLYVSERVIRQLLDAEGYRRRQIQKYLDMGSHEDRDAQFENIARIKREYLDSPEPILSIDTKKRELLGTFYRDGRVDTRRGLLAFDHDFPGYADGVVIPYGLYESGRRVQFPLPPLFVNLRLVATHRDTSRLKPLIAKSLRRSTTKANRVNKQHGASFRVRPLLPKVLLMSRKPIAISLPSLLPGATSQTPCELH